MMSAFITVRHKSHPSSDHMQDQAVFFLSIVIAYFGGNKWLFLLFITHHSLWNSDSLLKEKKVKNNRVMEAMVVGYAEGPM